MNKAELTRALSQLNNTGSGNILVSLRMSLEELRSKSKNGSLYNPSRAAQRDLEYSARWIEALCERFVELTEKEA